jgi:hypothetical protein
MSIDRQEGILRENGQEQGRVLSPGYPSKPTSISGHRFLIFREAGHPDHDVPHRKVGTLGNQVVMWIR